MLTNNVKEDSLGRNLMTEILTPLTTDRSKVLKYIRIMRIEIVVLLKEQSIKIVEETRVTTE